MPRKNLRRERERHRQEENKRWILEAAEKIFALKGYALATVDDIASESQFSKATIYRYFKSKAEIFLEIIHASLEESLQEVARIRSGPANAEEKLRDFILYVISYYQMKQNLARILFVEKTAMKKILQVDPDHRGGHPPFHPKLPARFMGKMKQISRMISEIIQEGVESGEFRAVEPEDASAVLGAMLRGFYFRGPVKEKEYSVREMTDLLYSYFLDGIRKHEVERSKGE